MSATAALIQELDLESKTTRRVLERVPSDKLAWKPHAKSMSLGTLAMHVASVPGFITSWALQDSVELSGGRPPEPTSTAEVLAAHDEGATKAKNALTTIGDAGLGAMWAMKTPDGKTIMAMPKGALVRIRRAQSPLPSPRTTLRVPAPARCARAVHLRSKRGRGPGRHVVLGPWFVVLGPERTMDGPGTRAQVPGPKAQAQAQAPRTRVL